MKLPFDPKGIADHLKDALPEIKLPRLGRVADIPVYVVHNSIDPDDYFFLFDFEVFVDRSKQGMFVRPRLVIWSGRDDFDRVIFARAFRLVFAMEFDQMRKDLAANGSKKWGWLSWDIGVDLASSFLTNLTAYALILVATGAGKALNTVLALPSWAKGRSAEAKLEDEVDQLKGQVEAALSEIEVNLHRDLYLHAFRGGPAGRLSGMDFDAWPLPENVRQHISDGRSSSWW